MRLKILKLGIVGLSSVTFQRYRFTLQAEERKLNVQIEETIIGEKGTKKLEYIKTKEEEKIKEEKMKEDIKEKANERLSRECILVVGTTGTGKSSTISKYTGQSVKVSDKPNSATRQVQAVPDSRGSKFPVWIDTIGYDDSFQRSDSESFQELLTFMQSQGLLKVKAIIWTVSSQERKDARLRRQSDFINQFKDTDIWNNVIIVVKQPGSYNLQQGSQGAVEAAKYYAGELSNLQVLGFTYLDEKIPAETLAKLTSLSPQERKERLLVTDVELVEQIDSALERINSPVQVIFEDSQCTACGVIGDKRLLPDFCHLEQTFVHKGKLRNYHPADLSGYHPLSLEAIHPGILKLTGGPNKQCETVRNTLGAVSPIIWALDVTTGLATAGLAGLSWYACGYLDSPYKEIFSCCGAEKFSTGCQVQYSCCKRKEENTGCCYTFSCCQSGPQSPGCIRRYDCCSREEEATGCLSICRKCGNTWGTNAAECYRTNHQLITYKS